MKPKYSQSKTAVVSNSRWAAYASAGFATALAGANSAEGEIQYSGLLNQKFNAPASNVVAASFQLDQLGDSFAFKHRRYGGSYAKFGIASFAIQGLVSAGFVGFTYQTGFKYASKLTFGQNISTKSFAPNSGGTFAVLAHTSFNVHSQWVDRDTGFIGFKFNSGTGTRFGWIRLRKERAPDNRFVLVDYAYGDVGDRVRTGQRSGGKVSAGQVPQLESLGGLAIGAVGLLAWRRRRAQPAPVL